MRLVVVSLLAAVGILGGCGGDDEQQPDPVVAVQLPDNLCDAVPAEVIERWHLVADDHGNDGDDDRREATCSMSGTSADRPVTLEVAIVSFGASSGKEVRQRVADSLADRCDALESGAGDASVTRSDNRCSTEGGADHGDVTEISRSIPSHGVVTVSMRATGPRALLVGAEVVGISGTLANTDPSDLTA